MSSSDTPLASPEAALQRLGQTAFRPGQRQAIAAVLAGEDALVILPTGGGKSLIYQVAALLLPGTTLVVSPLIALVRDQAEDLRERGYPGVAALHSQIPESEQRATLAALRAGDVRLLFVTPERCASDDFLGVAREATVSLLAVDEAHCISEWGHDFRPSYQLLDDAARALRRPPILALTATATPPVRDDIIQRLELRQPRVIVRGFDRPNLFLEVYPVGDERDKQAALSHILTDEVSGYPGHLGTELARAGKGSGLVYAALTRTCRTLSQWLNRQGVHTAYYHGQLKASQRNAVQDRFREGSVRTIVATNAFGMGIDRADLRFVAHYDAPPSMEAYYQEAGRAGRDGDFARCPLLFAEQDLSQASFVGGTGALPLEELERVAAGLESAPAAGVTRSNLAARLSMPVARVVRALELLVAVGAARERRGHYRPAALDGERLQRAAARDERRQTHDRTRIEMVRAYARVEGCRRQFVLQYFGQYDAPDHCRMCDRCVPRIAEQERFVVQPAASASAPASPFLPGDAVQHETWGRGVVQNVQERRITVHFPDGGYRTLDLDAVVERELLAPAPE